MSDGWIHFTYEMGKTDTTCTLVEIDASRRDSGREPGKKTWALGCLAPPLNREAGAP